MNYCRIITIFCIVFFCLIIFGLNMPALSQYLPWSWPPASPFPGTRQIPLYSYPPSGYFPSARPYISSGWPSYVPPTFYSYTPTTTQAPTTSSCPVGLIAGLTLEEEFGPGTRQITRCLIFNYDNKMLFHISSFESRPGSPYGLGNITAAINDYEITHGTKDYKIVSVNHSGGATQLLNINAADPHPLAFDNIYQPLVEGLIAKGVKFYM